MFKFIKTILCLFLCLCVLVGCKPAIGGDDSSSGTGGVNDSGNQEVTPDINGMSLLVNGVKTPVNFEKLCDNQANLSKMYLVFDEKEKTISFSKDFSGTGFWDGRFSADIKGSFEANKNYKIAFEAKASVAGKHVFETGRASSEACNGNVFDFTTEWQKCELFTGKYNQPANSISFTYGAGLVDSNVVVSLKNISISEEKNTGILEDMAFATYSHTKEAYGQFEKGVTKVDGTDVFYVKYLKKDYLENDSYGQFTKFVIPSVTEKGFYKISLDIKTEKPILNDFSLVGRVCNFTPDKFDNQTRLKPDNTKWTTYSVYVKYSGEGDFEFPMVELGCPEVNTFYIKNIKCEKTLDVDSAFDLYYIGDATQGNEFVKKQFLTKNYIFISPDTPHTFQYIATSKGASFNYDSNNDLVWSDVIKFNSDALSTNQYWIKNNKVHNLSSMEFTRNEYKDFVLTNPTSYGKFVSITVDDKFETIIEDASFEDFKNSNSVSLVERKDSVSGSDKITEVTFKETRKPISIEYPVEFLAKPNTSYKVTGEITGIDLATSQPCDFSVSVNGNSNSSVNGRITLDGSDGFKSGPLVVILTSGSNTKLTVKNLKAVEQEDFKITESPNGEITVTKNNEGLSNCLVKTFNAERGKYYRFSADVEKTSTDNSTTPEKLKYNVIGNSKGYDFYVSMYGLSQLKLKNISFTEISSPDINLTVISQGDSGPVLNKIPFEKFVDTDGLTKWKGTVPAIGFVGFQLQEGNTDDSFYTFSRLGVESDVFDTSKKGSLTCGLDSLDDITPVFICENGTETAVEIQVYLSENLKFTVEDLGIVQ